MIIPRHGSNRRLGRDFDRVKYDSWVSVKNLTGGRGLFILCLLLFESQDSQPGSRCRPAGSLKFVLHLFLEIDMIKHLLVSTTLLLALALSPVQAQTVPFKMNGSGSAPFGASVFGFDSPHNATGNGTHLGNYTGNEGLFKSQSFDPGSLSGTFKGQFVFVAANGDRLVCTYGDTENGAATLGEYFAVPSANAGEFNLVFCAEFNPQVAECTGRFAKLTGGSFTVLAMSEPIVPVLDAQGYTPPFQLDWEGEGTLTFGNKQ